jgi:peptide/nickel transport system permease protein
VLDDALKADAPADLGAARSRWRGVARYVAGRLGQGVLVLFGAVTASFILIHATGNPATVLAGGQLPPAQVRALSAQLGYNRPLLDQYLSYLSRGARRLR